MSPGFIHSLYSIFDIWQHVNEHLILHLPIFC